MLLGRLARVWKTYLQGQLLASLLLGCMTWMLNEIIGLHWPIQLGLIAGVMNTLPGLGPILAIVPAAFVALWKGSSTLSVHSSLFVLITIAGYVGIQQLSALIIEPRLIGQHLELPPLVVLLAVLTGAALGGVLGAYLAVPVLASLREILLSGGRPRR